MMGPTCQSCKSLGCIFEDMVECTKCTVDEDAQQENSFTLESCTKTHKKDKNGEVIYVCLASNNIDVPIKAKICTLFNVK